MAKTVIQTSNAPEAVGAYNQAISANGLVFCSGQIALTADGSDRTSESVTEQTRQCLTNLQAVLAEAGSSLDNAVKVTAFLTDMGDFGEFNEVYAEFFTGEVPARATVGVAALPKGARVEVECIALG
ncbi:MAG: RidA family protein [Actinomycetota bacterium]